MHEHIIELGSDYDLAHYYDLRTKDIVEDAEFYANWFNDSPKVIVEFGCGTGRVLKKVVARQCHRAIGIDNSRAMLEIARTNLAGADITLLEADVSRPFDESTRSSIEPADVVLIVFNAFHEILGIRKRMACLNNALSILNSTGFVVIDVGLPGIFDTGSSTVSNKKIGEFIDSEGSKVECFVSLEVDWLQQNLRGHSLYVVTASNDCVRQFRTPLRSDLLKPDELMLLCQVTGSKIVEAWGNYKNDPFDWRSRRFIAKIARSPGG